MQHRQIETTTVPSDQRRCIFFDAFVETPDDIRLADTHEAFANECLELLADEKLRNNIADAAWNMVSTRFSWDSVSRCFEQILEAGPSIR